MAFRGSELLVIQEELSARLPISSEWRPETEAPEPVAPLVIGELGGFPCFAVALPAEFSPPEGMALHGLRRLWGLVEEEAWRMAGRAVQLLDWDRNHRYCGRCGAETEPRPPELSRTCPRCGQQHFPRLSPAVIVLIEDGDRMLLARSPHFQAGVYSTIAGFVEPGESLEETVAREVREEVGVEVAEVRYFGSQPWPFPHSLMIGFVARYAGGEVRIDGVEIEDARWFDADDLPRLLPSKISIARALVEDFLARRGRQLPEGRDPVWR